MPINVIKDNTITNTGVPAVINNVWSNLLPSGYTQLEYIQSSGTQWIDTGVVVNFTDLTVEYKYRKTDTLARNAFGYDGPLTHTYSKRLMHGHIYLNKGYYGNTSVITTIPQELNTDYEVKFEISNALGYGRWTVNGVEYSGSSIGMNGWTDANTATQTYTDGIFCTKDGNNTNYMMLGRIYYLRYYKNNTELIANFIPAKRTSDNVLGMYDTVTNTFFTNAGTGDFIAGPAQPSYTIKGNTVQTNNLLPVEYKAIDFIESHGTEYIDTGYAKPNTKCRVKTRVSFNDTTSRFLIGPSGQSPNYFGRYRNKFELNNVYTTMTTTVGTIYDLDYVCNGTTVALTASDGTTTETLTANQAGSIYNNNWFVYGLNTGSSASFILKGKIYKFELYDNGTLVRDMIPAKRLTDNVLGMYDKVEGKFYTNKGTGSFSGAEEMSENLFDITGLQGSATVSYSGDTITLLGLNVDSGKTLTQIFPDAEVGQTYYLSRDNSSTARTYIWLRTGGAGGQWSFGNAKTLTAEDFNGTVKFYANNANGTIVKMQITKGSTAPTSYTPYGQIPADTDNTCDIPSPTHPVELHSVGDKTENLLNKNDSTLVSGYYLNANGSQAQSDTWFITPYIPCEPNTVYSQYGITNKGGAPSICYYDINKNYISGTAHNGGILYPITTPANAYYFRDSFHVNDKDDMTIVKGSTAPTSYIPYGYAVPIFHQGDCGVIDLGTLNWNRIDPQGTTFPQGWFQTTLSSKQPGTTNNFYLDGYIIGVSGTDKHIWGNSINSLINITDYRFTDATAFKQAMSGKYLYYQRTTDTEWTTGVQTIYPANPLRRISNTYYDYIDYENQRIVRNVGVRICIGTETYNKWGSSTNKIWFDISDKQPSLDILCNCYKKSEYQIATQLQNNEIVGSSSSKSCILCDSVNAVDVTTFKAWLAEQYNNNNPVTILYPLATPTYEAITLPVLPVETQDKLNLYNVQTKLAPSEISVTYRGNLVEGHNITYNNKYYPIKYNNTDY